MSDRHPKLGHDGQAAPGTGTQSLRERVRSPRLGGIVHTQGLVALRVAPCPGLEDAIFNPALRPGRLD